jgi:membrane protein YdbS with pleckstrin-like domain
MFEQLEGSGKVPQVSKAMSLGMFAAYLVGAFGSLCIFIVFGDRPFGMQIATAITYTYFAFWYVFFPTRGLLEKYSPRNKRVQRQIPLVLAIHFAFLIAIFLGQTIWFAKKPRLPSYWLAEHGKGGWTWYVLVTMGFLVFTFFAEVLISRRTLSRSLREGLNKSGSD